MRRNIFGDSYCTTSLEITRTLQNEDREPDDVYLASIDGPEGSDVVWTGDICDNVSGDIVCYVEAATEDEVVKIARQAGVNRV